METYCLGAFGGLDVFVCGIGTLVLGEDGVLGLELLDQVGSKGLYWQVVVLLVTLWMCWMISGVGRMVVLVRCLRVVLLSLRA